MIVRMVFGSHLYGTATEGSDTDYKGVRMPSNQEVLLGKIPRSHSLSVKNSDGAKNEAGDVDEEIYSLHHFIKLACEGQTVALDMLHAPASALTHTSRTWEILQDRRAEFYTKNLHALVGYARKQAAKYGIKGSRLADAKRALAFLKDQPAGVKLSDVWGQLPQGEHLVEGKDRADELRVWDVCGKKLLETSKVSHYIPTLEQFVDRYGNRAKLAANSKGIDWKAISHAMRAALQVRAILKDGGFEYPLPETKLLCAVKAGSMLYPAAAEWLERTMDEVDDLARASTLPEQVDRDVWDRWLIERTWDGLNE